MRILFIENRYKTYFFEAIAEQLSKTTIEACFLIQNKRFLPKGNFKNYIIPYPKNINKDYSPIQDIEVIIKSDRQQNHFNKNSKSYFYYYYEKIDRILDDLNPDFVFGEATAFHELLTINLCKKKKIIYLNPSSCRYPISRFSFYEYDTLKPYKGSGEVLGHKVALDTIKSIIDRTAKPDYMKAISVSKSEKIRDKIRLVSSFVEGEKYNTPNPLTKIVLEKQKRKNIREWNNLSVVEVSNTDKFKILYPLQMQPEANIDVWGRSYRNQTALISQILESIEEDVVLYVKPNPKSKYELNAQLLDLIEQSKNCIALHHATKMNDVLDNIDLVLTVTGTVAIESILNNKPVVTMVNTLNNSVNNCKYISNITEELPKVIGMVKNKTFPTISLEEKIDFINELNKSSYRGVISDPFNNPNCVSRENIESITQAFKKVIFE